MDCPSCRRSETRVVETRLDSEGHIKRRRECLHCGFRITTIESPKVNHVKHEFKPQPPIETKPAFKP